MTQQPITLVELAGEELRKVRMQRDNARAELDNLGPLLQAAGELSAKLATELVIAMAELRELQDARDELAEAEIRADELAEELDEMRAELGERTTELAQARNDRDTMRQAVPFHG